MCRLYKTTGSPKLTKWLFWCKQSNLKIFRFLVVIFFFFYTYVESVAVSTTTLSAQVTWENIPSDMCTCWRLKSACTSTQFDQSSLSTWRNFTSLTIQNVLREDSDQHTCHKLWTKSCEMRQNFKGDLTKFCEIFLNITLKLPQYSLSLCFSCKKLVKTTTVCDLCLFLHKICCKMVWKFCEIWNLYGNWFPDWTNSVRFYLTVWDMACMDQWRKCAGWSESWLGTHIWRNNFW